MFISTDDRSAGETKISPASQAISSSLWVLLVRTSQILQICEPDILGCMTEARFKVLAAILKEPPSKIQAQFACVSETKKPQALKVGEENEMRILNQQIQFVACRCMFYFEVVQSL